MPNAWHGRSSPCTSSSLLTLLTLQIRIEQIDDAHLAGLPDARLKHYNAVLREQVAALDAEIAGTLEPLFASPLPMAGPLPKRSDLERELRAHIAQLQRWCAEVEDEIAALDDPARRDALITRLQSRFQEADAGAGIDMDDLDFLFGLSQAMAPGSAGGFAPSAGKRKPGASKKKTKAGRKRR